MKLLLLPILILPCCAPQGGVAGDFQVAPGIWAPAPGTYDPAALSRAYSAPVARPGYASATTPQNTPCVAPGGYWSAEDEILYELDTVRDELEDLRFRVEMDRLAE